MESFVMTDWITISGMESASPLSQPASGWLELDDEHADREDVIFYLEVKEATNAMLSYETAGVRQHNQFVVLRDHRRIPAVGARAGPQRRTSTGPP